MKRKRLSAVLGIVLALVMLAGLTVQFASAAVGNEYTIEFLNPLGRVEPQDNQPLIERIPWQLDGNGHLKEKKVIMRLQYSSNNVGDALAMMLIDEYGKYGEYYPDAGIIFVTAGLGGNWGAKTEASYNVNWVNPTGVAGSPSYWRAPTGSPADWNDKYAAGNGVYAGRIDIAIMGLAD
ncbi:MAG: hypothetical protein LBH28_09490 [Oscillospiraceae bacterium]|nr:hypothetical protein [Oscillospiraceae bacterium]